MAGTGFSFPRSSSSFGFSNPSSAISAPSFCFASSAASSPFSCSSLFGASSTNSSTTTSPFGGSNLFGFSSSGAAPTSNLFGSSSGTARTANLFGSSSAAAPASNPFGSVPNNFGSSSGGGVPTSSFFGSSSSVAAQTASPFGAATSTAVPSTPSPSSSPFGTSTPFGTPASGSSNLFGSGAPTPSLFGASLAAPASNVTSPFGSGSVVTSGLFGSTTPAANEPTFGSGLNLNSGNNSCTGGSDNHLGVGSGDCGVNKGEEVTERLELPIDQGAALDFPNTVLLVGIKDGNEKGDATSKDESVGCSISACSVISTATSVADKKTLGVEASSYEDTLKHEASFVAKDQPSKVVHESSGNSREVLDKNESGHPADGGFSLVEVQMNPSLQNTLSLRKAQLIEQILRKYGDITKGSILRSMEAKTYFLQLVAEVVGRLQSYTRDTICTHDILIMEKWTEDAVAVGFNVEWLQQRIKKVTAISKFQDNLTCLNEISEKVDAARIALWEMELQQMIVKKEMEFMKADMDMEDFGSRTNLCEGLF